jgi:transglycosylase-like protein
VRKVLIPALCASAAAVPAVALAATSDNPTDAQASASQTARALDTKHKLVSFNKLAHHRTAPHKAPSMELRLDSQHKLESTVQRAKHERAKEREAKARKSAGATTASTGGSTGGASTASPQLEAIAACESGGNPSAIGGGGAYRGKYQFDYGTWASVGGSGDPAAAPESEQDMRAAMLLQRSGTSPWPVCGQ